MTKNHEENHTTALTKVDRHSAIASYVDGNGFVEVTELAQNMNVTAETIRTDLLAMAKDGRINRVRGGAQPATREDQSAKSDGPLDLMLSGRANQQPELKRSIAAIAALELPEEEGGMVILDAGSSVSQLAATFPTDKPTNVVTNSVEIAAELASNNNVDVTITGGKVRPGALAVVGNAAIEEISERYADIAFVSSDTASIKRGLMSFDGDEAELKRHMVKSAERVVALLDHTKFDHPRKASVNAAKWSDIDVVITDTSASEELLTQLRSVVKEVRVAPPRRVVGVDIGGKGIRAAIIDTATGTVVGERKRRPTPKPSTVESVVDVVSALVAELQWDGRVGIAMPGKLEKGKVTTKTYLDDSWYRKNAEKEFSDALERPVTVINDADAAGHCEAEFGAGAGVDGTVIMLVVGTGIGSFKMDRGSVIHNTEFGHVPLALGAAHNLTRRDQLEKLGKKQWSKNFNELLEVIAKKHKPARIIVGGGFTKDYEDIEDLMHAPKDVELVVAIARNRAEMIGAAYWRSAHDRSLSDIDR